MHTQKTLCYLFTDRLEDGGSLPEYPVYETHAAPKGPAPPWQLALKKGQQAAARGDFYRAIKAHDDVLESGYLSGRMSATVRYEALLSLR